MQHHPIILIHFPDQSMHCCELSQLKCITGNYSQHIILANSLVPRLSCLHTTPASVLSHESSHTVPHFPFWHSSTLPSFEFDPPTRRREPEVQTKVINTSVRSTNLFYKLTVTRYSSILIVSTVVSTRVCAVCQKLFCSCALNIIQEDTTSTLTKVRTWSSSSTCHNVSFIVKRNRLTCSPA